ncbi:MAG TPA: LCP family protein [Acidimicrobiia bacterium]|nr:LCP family protein [Acidimicrobiia bacterium]
MKRTIVVSLIAANVLVFGALGVVWWAAQRVSSSVSTIPSTDLSLAGTPDVSEPRTFLLVGSDSRENLEDLTNFGAAGGQRADVIILLQVLPDASRMQLLSIPRDLRVDYGGRVGRINAAFGSGAADLVGAVAEETGLPIHHYLQVEFGGFASIIDAIGGIRLTFPYPARDLSSGLAVNAGTQLLDGETALSYARSRKYQELRNGGWVSVDANDIGRTRRQQDVLLAILTQVDRPTSLSGFEDLVDALGGFVVADSGFDAEEIIQLAWSMRSISGSDVESMTLPVKGFEENGTSYVVRVEPEASNVIDAFGAGAPMSVDAEARIQVHNGSGIAGSAAAVATVLATAGFDVLDTVDSARSDYQTTEIVAGAANLALAQAVADALGYGEVIVGRTPADVEVVVIVGADAPTG